MRAVILSRARGENGGGVASAGAAADGGRARTADTILNQLEGDLVADEQLVERAKRRVAAVEEHLAALDVANETVALAGVKANNSTACRTATGRAWLVRFAGTGGRLRPLVHSVIMSQYGVSRALRGRHPGENLPFSRSSRRWLGKLGVPPTGVRHVLRLRR